MIGFRLVRFMTKKSKTKKKSTSIQVYVNELDAWIKQVRHELSDVPIMRNAVRENISNIQHNYELIHELQHQIGDLKEEVKALKIMQVISLRKNHGSKTRRQSLD